jgi:citrate synthase
MSDATLTHDGGSLVFKEIPATVGSNGYNTGALLKETGRVALDYGFMNTASCESAITYIVLSSYLWRIANSGAT